MRDNENESSHSAEFCGFQAKNCKKQKFLRNFSKNNHLEIKNAVSDTEKGREEHIAAKKYKKQGNSK